MKLDNNVFDILKTRLVVNVSIFITSKIVLSVSTHKKRKKSKDFQEPISRPKQKGQKMFKQPK